MIAVVGLLLGLSAWWMRPNVPSQSHRSEYRAARRQVLRKRFPLTARPKHVEDGVQDLAGSRRAWRAGSASRPGSEPSEVPKEPESLFDFNFRQSDEAAH